MKKYSFIAGICLCLIWIISGCGPNDKKSPTPTPTPVPTLSSSAVNLLYDSNFDSTSFATGWYQWYLYDGDQHAIFELVGNEADHYLHFCASYCGSDWWDEQFMGYPSLRLKSGKSYFVSLIVMSDKPGWIKPMLEGTVAENFDYIGGYEIFTSITPATYTGFLVTASSDRNAQFVINVGNLRGGSIKNDGVNFYFDDIQLLEQ